MNGDGRLGHASDHVNNNDRAFGNSDLPGGADAVFRTPDASHAARRLDFILGGIGHLVHLAVNSARPDIQLGVADDLSSGVLEGELVQKERGIGCDLHDAVVFPEEEVHMVTLLGFDDIAGV